MTSSPAYDPTNAEPSKRAPNTNSPVPHKSAMTAVMLCLVGGMIGLHRFYLGKLFTGMLMLLTAGGFGFWYIFDLILLVTNKFKDKEGQALILVPNSTPFHKALMIVGATFFALMTYVLSIFAVLVYITHEIRTLAHQELEALRGGNLDLAYTYTSRSYQNHMPLGDFKTFVKQNPALTNHKSVFFYFADKDNTVGVLEGTLTTEDDSTVPVGFVFVKEGTFWKILSIKVGP